MEPKPLTEEELDAVATGQNWRDVVCSVCGRAVITEAHIRDFMCPCSLTATRTGPSATERIVAEVRRLRSILSTASSYLVDQDAHCQGCGRSMISADAEHSADCTIGKIIREFGNEDD